MRARASDREWHDGRYEPVDWGARARAVLDSYVEQLYDAVRAHIEAELRASLAAKVRRHIEVDHHGHIEYCGEGPTWFLRLIEGSDPASPEQEDIDAERTHDPARLGRRCPRPRRLSSRVSRDRRGTVSYEGMFDETYDGYCECCGRVRPLYYDSTCAPCHEARVFDEPHEHPR